MQLLLFKTLWGHEGSLEQAIQQAVKAGFDGIEGPAPARQSEAQVFRQQLNDNGLNYIAEITTAGSYVPERNATLQEHVDSFARKLEQSLVIEPDFVTSLAGCDAWPESESVEFFGRLMEIAADAAIEVSFETHRSRSFFNPWTTQRICEQLPGLQLTFDFSHWCVVSERLMDSEPAVIEALAPRARHIHARVGYDQGPQVPDPRHALYQHALQRHQAWWQQLWIAMAERGFDKMTMTPEFGPDGYQAINMQTGEPVGDLWQFNQWMAEVERQHFGQFIASG